MKSIFINALVPPVDIYGATGTTVPSTLLVSGHTEASYTVAGIDDSVQYYTIRIEKEGCEPLTKTFTFTITPTPTPTHTATPTPTVSPSAAITWEPFGGECEKEISCQEGYTLSSDGSYCIAYTTTGATEGQLVMVDNRQDGAYSNYGAKIYQVNGYNGHGVELSGYDPDYVTTTPLWANPTELIGAVGRLNTVGVWAVSGTCESNVFIPLMYEWIGFTTTVLIPERKLYYIGIAGDNLIRFRVNGTTLVEQENDQNAENFKYWHIYPVWLEDGYNFIELSGWNSGGPASFGAEIYNNTAEELAAATSESDLEIVFTTKNFFCGTINSGSSNYGYQCPEGYTLDMNSGSPICRKRMEVAPTEVTTGYITYPYRRRLVGGVADGYAEANSPTEGLGPYFPPQIDLDNCAVSSPDPTPTPTPTLTPTPSITPTRTPTPTPSRSYSQSGCLISAVDATVESIVGSATSANITFNINGMGGGYYGLGNIYNAFWISLSSCRPCITQSGSVQFIRRGSTVYDIMNYTVTSSGYVRFEGYLYEGYLWDAVFTVAKQCSSDSGGCIAKGSRVTMANGTTKNIEDLATGDLLMSLDISGVNEVSYHHWQSSGLETYPSLTKVVAVYKHTANKVIRINEVLTSTFEHKHFIKRGDKYLFVEAQNISTGDALLHESGNMVTVFKKEVLSGFFETYNLDVEELDVYFINGLLTHNKEIPNDEVPQIS